MTDSCNLICWASSTLSDFQLAAASYPATNQKCAAPIFTGSAANSQLLQIYFCTRWLCLETCGYLFPVAQTASFKGKKRKQCEPTQTRRLRRCSFTQTDKHACFSQSGLALVWFTGWPLTQAGLSWMDFWPCSCSNWTLVFSCDPSPERVLSFGPKHFIYFERVFFWLFCLLLKLTDRSNPLFQIVIH